MSEVTLTVTEAAHDLSELIERIRSHGDTVVLTQDGQPVARISPAKHRTVTGAELARIWKDIPHLSPENAEAFERDIEEGRKFFKPYVSPWD